MARLPEDVIRLRKDEPQSLAQPQQEQCVRGAFAAHAHPDADVVGWPAFAAQEAPQEQHGHQETGRSINRRNADFAQRGAQPDVGAVAQVVLPQHVQADLIGRQKRQYKQDARPGMPRRLPVIFSLGWHGCDQISDFRFQIAKAEICNPKSEI
jgi:hypothetical protein